MDEISKEIKRQNKGVQIPETNEKIGCLLWVDDVVLMSTSEEELQEMLNITDDIAKRYHLEFGKGKSQTMEVKKTQKRKKSKNNKEATFNLGSMIMDKTETYKYLGETINSKANLDSHIEP